MRDWPKVRLTRAPKSDKLRFAPITPAPGYERASRFLTETYVPASQLKEQEERCEELEEALREAHHAIVETAKLLIVVEHKLKEPYPDDPRWSPWTRFVDRSENTPWKLLGKADVTARTALQHSPINPSGGEES